MFGVYTDRSRLKIAFWCATTLPFVIHNRFRAAIRVLLRAARVLSLGFRWGRYRAAAVAALRRSWFAATTAGRDGTGAE